MAIITWESDRDFIYRNNPDRLKESIENLGWVRKLENGERLFINEGDKFIISNQVYISDNANNKGTVFVRVGIRNDGVVDYKSIGNFYHSGEGKCGFKPLSGSTLFYISDHPDFPLGEPSYGKSNGGCYIATCVYGSYDCSEVWTLRHFRDDTLFKYKLGRLFVRVYYKISPLIVTMFGSKQWFSKMVKPVLDKIVFKLNGVV
jgi:hypothetical protein